MTLLIDTNVALDFLLNRAPWADDAQRVFELALETGQTISVTANAVTDIYYIARRQLQSGAEARRILERVLSVFDVLDVTGRDCRNALADEMPDYEDALAMQCAAVVGARYIITRDTRHFEGSPVPPLTPDQYIKMFAYWE